MKSMATFSIDTEIILEARQKYRGELSQMINNFLKEMLKENKSKIENIDIEIEKEKKNMQEISIKSEILKQKIQLLEQKKAENKEKLAKIKAEKKKNKENYHKIKVEPLVLNEILFFREFDINNKSLWEVRKNDYNVRFNKDFSLNDFVLRLNKYKKEVLKK